MTRSYEQELSQELHIARDHLHLDREGSFVTFLMRAFVCADRDNFDLTLPVVRQVIDKYRLSCTCKPSDRGPASLANGSLIV